MRNYINIKLTMTAAMAVALVGCGQFRTPPTVPTPHRPHEVVQEPTVQPPEKNDSGVQVTPYDIGEIKKESLPAPTTTVVVPRPQPRPVTGNSSTAQQPAQPPAFVRLISQAQQAVNQQNLDKAQHLASQAQRISPQAAESYSVLSQVALQKNNLPQAQSLAQRGISLANDANTKKQLWHVVLQTAQRQNNMSMIEKAQNALASLP
ncbi:tetratricopeptide repeat protein [Acinetobacter apis]|uniref:Tetratricopeptide repeat-containing protein n=1 Tax=Acinetobacter apis TaxID=1229165 RepID=A0A217EET8_9GAMM|nr:hypothetical protein [Acinetobacter apis]SNQ28993.1 hypothetical protein SAMN05444584_0924 [Acinetobacter apis]